MSDAPVSIDAAFVATWLALPNLAAQTAHLQTSDLLHERGLAELVEWAGPLARRDPSQARQLTTLCLEIAEAAGIPRIIPRATYLKAQTHALAGELETARQLVRAAQAGYVALGQEMPALATNVGLMHILAESGQYEDALAAGQSVLDRAGDNPEGEMMRLAAQVQQNRGLCYRRLGQYEAALHAYRTAEAHYLSLGLLERAGDIGNNRGVLLLELGRGPQALSALEAALALRAAAGQTFLQAQTWNNLGSAHLLLGNYSQSLAAFEQARQLFAAQEPTLDQHILLLDTAYAYQTVNLYPEAVAAYRQAEQALAAAGATPQRARALWGLGESLLAQGHLAEAAQVLESAVALLQFPPTPLLATALLEQAAALAAGGAAAAALTAAEEALRLAENNNWLVPQLYAHLRLADLQQESAPQAEAHLLAAQPLVETLGLPQLRYRWLERYGRWQRRQGNDAAAQTYLEAAVAEIERLRSTLAQEKLRASFLQDKVIAYNELVQLFLSRGDVDSLQQAFAVAEQAKSRALVDLMQGTITTQLAAQGEDQQQLEQLQTDLNALYNDLLNSDAQADRKIRYADAPARATQLEQAISRLQLQMSADDLPADPLMPTFAPGEIAARLPADVTLLSYYQIEEEVMAFVSHQGTLSVFRQLCRVPEVEDLLHRLNAQWSRFRAGEAFIARHLPVLTQAAQRLLGTLYDLLFAPLESALAGGEKVTIIPHGLLHHVPFHALFDGQDYLLERFEMSYAPSATVYVLCQSRQALREGKTIIMGVPDPAIPAVTEEVMAVAAGYADAQVYLDEQATLATLQTQADGCACLHLACHGFFRADNPMFSALRLHDGWLTALQAAQLNLPHAFVVLSGCETGLSQVISGDELLGLTRAFLGAGASTLVVSLWLAQDKTTATLMSALHKQLQQEPGRAAAALRLAQRAVKAAHPHPYYWAPFILVGQRHTP